jgi:hypothetical protein
MVQVVLVDNLLLEQQVVVLVQQRKSALILMGMLELELVVLLLD